MMRFHVLTLFPDMIEEGAHNSILARAMDKGLIGVEAVNIRDYTQNRHGRVDDYIYGGGAGLLMQAQPVYDAWEALSGKIREERGEDPGEQRPVRTVYLSPQGKVFSQEIAEELSREEDLILLCGHYEGIDERVLEEIVTDEISIGDYVLTGGELPALVLIDAVSRLVPGVLRGDGFVPGRSSGVSAVLPPRRVAGEKGAADPPVRRPREGGRLAQRAVCAQNERETTGSL